jgi:hypothetical protein
MSRLRLRDRKQKKRQHLVLYSLYDPRLRPDQRDFLREVLTAYAKKMFGSKSPNELVGITEEQFITTTFELYEQGDIRLWRLDNGWKIEPCQPGEAPQLKHPLATPS